ncbi:MAG: hypothetical protein V3G42_02970 [Oscillospiraceae bacterium]
MPDYKELFYQSQAQLADLAEKLRELSDEIYHKMECAEEEILSETDNTSKNN